MKKCIYCAEEIQDEAIKCKHCFEFLDGRPRSDVAPPAPPQVQASGVPWYCSTVFMVSTFIMVPPLVLPSVWLHPKLHLVFKILITVIVAAFCWLFYWAIDRFIHQFDEATRMWEQSPY